MKSLPASGRLEFLEPLRSQLGGDIRIRGGEPLPSWNQRLELTADVAEVSAVEPGAARRPGHASRSGSFAFEESYEVLSPRYGS